MAVFNVDGLEYTDKLPHSRVERILYKILAKQSGGGGSDDPDIGYGLTIVGNTIRLDTIDDMSQTSNKPITSNAVATQIEKAETIMSRI